MGPETVGLVLEVGFLFCAADAGIAGGAPRWGVWVGEDVDDVADLLGLEFGRKGAGVVVALSGDTVHAMLGGPLGEPYVVVANDRYSMTPEL